MGVCRVVCDDATPCPTGQVCTSFGECVSGDAGSPDGGSRPRDAGNRADAGPDAGRDAGAPVEACTPSTLGSSPADEDGDGAIDEGCAWSFGVPHAVTGAHPSAGLVNPTALSSDGLRLWVTAPGAGGARRIHLIDRAALDAPFARSTDVTTALGITSPHVVAFWLSPDELEIIYDDDARSDSGSDLYRATRASASVPFGPATPIAALNTPGATRDYGPKLTDDGLEIFFTRFSGGVRSMWHARRTSRDTSFEAPSPVNVAGTRDEDAVPLPSADGLTIFFTRRAGGTWTIQSAARASRSTVTFGAPSPFAALTAPPYSVVALLSERTREAFVFSDRAWSPGSYGVWRAQICRDGPCPVNAVECPAPAVRSPDGLHCYSLGADANMDAAIAACAAAGGHLVTIHSAAEQELVWSTFGSPTALVRLGLEETSTVDVFAWITGEPLTYTRWHPTEPNPGPGETTALMVGGSDGQWADFAASQVGRTVCEAELWPVW
jgi:hypothetical protein